MTSHARERKRERERESTNTGIKLLSPPKQNALQQGFDFLYSRRRLDDILPGKLALAEQPEPMERAEAEPAEKPGGYLVPGTVPVVPTVVHPEGVGFAKWKEEVNDLEAPMALTCILATLQVYLQ